MTDVSAPVSDLLAAFGIDDPNRVASVHLEPTRAVVVMYLVNMFGKKYIQEDGTPAVDARVYPITMRKVTG